MNSNDERMITMFLEAATASGDPDQIVSMVGKVQTILVSLFSLYILISAKEHDDHETDCEIMEQLPKAIDSFIAQLTEDIRLHVEMNLKVNGIELEKTANQKQYDEIMAEIKAQEAE
ncbi:MAG: hypothetical protein GQ553_04655 [Nitrosomonadaceae bacterium]|nr:hypothetical protein [Nitrosomonadaceae bacterium]